MQRNKEKFLVILKWLIMFLAYGYLIYKLVNVRYWSELKLSFETINASRIIFFISVLILMPLNWALEAWKWQILTNSTIKLSFVDSVKSVLAGLNSGFITPGRIGDFAGRVLYFPPELRLKGTLLSFVNGFIQTFIITVFGVISFYFYSTQIKENIDFSRLLLYLQIFLAVAVLMLLLFPKIFKESNKKSWIQKFNNALKSISTMKIKTLIMSALISMLRFAVFCFQYYLMLHFFNVNLNLQQALIGIPTMYLIVTYAPTLATSEAAVRASTAVLILGVFSNNEIGILLTGILIWLINFIVPMMAGSVLMAKSEHLNS